MATVTLRPLLAKWAICPARCFSRAETLNAMGTTLDSTCLAKCLRIASVESHITISSLVEGRRVIQPSFLSNPGPSAAGFVQCFGVDLDTVDDAAGSSEADDTQTNRH
jgi:hypothetical protein